KVTIPSADSRTRSRRARSSGGSSPSPPSDAGSQTRRSRPLPTSNDQSCVTGSSPAGDRRKRTREPSAAIRNARGTPRVNRRVRACCRGKVSRSPPLISESLRGRRRFLRVLAPPRLPGLGQGRDGVVVLMALGQRFRVLGLDPGAV